MKITVTCAGCGKHYDVDSGFAGKSGKCSTCGARMTIPDQQRAAAPIAPEAEAYQLGEAHDHHEPSAFTQARGTGDADQPRRERRPTKKTARRPGRRAGEAASAHASPPYRALLIGLSCVVAVLVGLAFLVPGARMNVGRLLGLAGLVLFVYGYGSGAYIAFSEDGMYGWLYLIFPPYAAYYFVSRWDEMRSRLVMVFLGLALLSGGGKLLELDRPPAPDDEGAPKVGARDGDLWPRLAAYCQINSRIGS